MTALKVIRRREPEVEPAPEPAPTPAEAAAEWYLAVEGVQFGPMPHAELCNRIRRGEAGHEAMVWREGFGDWLEVDRVPALPRLPPPAPAIPAPREPAPLPAPAPSPAPGPAPAPAATAVPAVHPRLPLLTKLSAAGGVTAGLCGLVLVAHVMTQNEQPVVREQIKLVPVEKAEVKQEPARPFARMPALVVTLPEEREAAPRQRRRRSAREDRPLTRLKPLPLIPAPRELVITPPRREAATTTDLSAVVARHQRADKKRMSSCYERAAKQGGALETVKAHLTLDIGRSGVVRVASVRAGGNSYLQRCLSKIVRRWTFPAGEAQELTFNVLFKGTGR